MKNNSEKNSLVTEQYLDKVLTNYPTKKDLNEALTYYPTKKDLNKSLKSLENKIIRKINQVLEFMENETFPLKRRVDRVESHLF